MDVSHSEYLNCLSDEEDDPIGLLEELCLSLRPSKRPQSNLPASPKTPTSRFTPTSSPTNQRDLTALATWTVSTAKPGNGIEQLLDGNPTTYWQSDGPQPHTISAHFCSRLKVSSIQLYLDYNTDESYTPAVVSVHAGSNFHDLRPVRKLRKLDAPQGWVTIPLGAAPRICDHLSDDEDSDDALMDLSPGEEAARLARRRERTKLRQEKLAKRQADLKKKHQDALAGVNGHLEAMRDHSVTRAHMIQILIHCNHQSGRDSHVRMVRALGPNQQVIQTASKFSSIEFQMRETIR